MMFALVIFCTIGAAFGDSKANGVNSFNEVNAAIRNSNDVLAEFGKAFNQRTQLDDIIKKTDQFRRYRTEYSSLVGPFVGEVKTLLLNSDDSYSAGPRFINDWCTESVPFLEAYVDLFKGYNEENAGIQKDMLKEAFETGVAKAKGAISMLAQTSSNFDAVIKKLKELSGQLSIDYAPGSEFVDSNVRATKLKAENNVPTVNAIVNEVVRQSSIIASELGEESRSDGLNRLASKTQPDVPSDQEITTNLKKKFDEVEQFYSAYANQVVRAKHDVDRTVSELNSKIGSFENFSNHIVEQPFTSFTAQDHSTIQSSVSDFKNQCQRFRSAQTKA